MVSPGKDSRDLTKDLKGSGGENRPQIVRANDINPSLRDNESTLEDELTKKYDQPRITIMDRTLADVLDKTLNFMVYSFGEYQVQVRKAELLVDEKEHAGNQDRKAAESIMDRLAIHGHALSLFAGDGDNSIYIGIILIVLSIIIYFIHITTH
jgi:hypothetical protein